MNNSSHPLIELLKSAIEQDFNQLPEYDVDPAPLRARFDALAAEGSLDALAAFQLELWRTPPPAAYPYDEPSDPETIRAGWPAGDGPAFTAGAAALQDRLAGAWLGRAAGCCFGKPFEGAVNPGDVEDLARALGGWPPDGYLRTWPEGAPPRTPRRGLPLRDRECAVPLMAYCPNDDDLNYPVCALMALERHGPGVTAPQLFQLIADRTPWSQIYSSGKNGARAALLGLPHPAGALFGNPTRQSLGAMIRCDVWAWVSPGRRRTAAEFALRDAVYTQTRNGIYAGVFWAVAIQTALTTGDVESALRTALDYVPPRSRLAEVVRWCFDQPARADFTSARDALAARFGRDDRLPPKQVFNHSVINSGIVILGVLYGGGDFSKTIALTVAGAYDTDCTGATAGSLLGAAGGAAALPPQWIAPLNDRYRSVLLGCHELRFSDLARRTQVLAEAMGRFA